MLQDDRIEKPRILRFFQEFFGYAEAHKVFKDEDRSGGFAYYGENYPAMYEKDADFFVMNILEKRQGCIPTTIDLRRILHSEQSHVSKYGLRFLQEKTNGNWIKASCPNPKRKELLQRLNLKGWHELNKKYNLHNFNKGFNGSVAAIKKIVDEQYSWMNTKDENVLLHRMQALYKKIPHGLRSQR